MLKGVVLPKKDKKTKESRQKKMDNHVQVVEILVADDDEDDRFLMEEALEEKDFRAVYFVEDGEELMDYLYHRGQYSSLSSSPRPNLILLDLNMPRKDGREALKEIKADHKLHRIPVVVMTTSKADLKEILAGAGWELVLRLPVYPQYYHCLPPHLQTAVQRYGKIDYN